MPSWPPTTAPKWLGDIRGGRGNPDWHADGPLLAMHLYRHHGDRRALETAYPDMAAYIRHLRARHPTLVIEQGFGDWCAPGDGSYQGSFRDPAEVNTALFALLARTAAEAAAALGKPEDTARFSELERAIAAAFHKRFFKPETATYGSGSQTTSLLPLALGLVPEAHREAVFDQLVETIEVRHKGHLHTGITGTRVLVDVLCDHGRPDLALSILTKTTYPSFGFQIAKGATTTWEQWSFKTGMQSFNHAMFAGVDASFFSHLAGLAPLDPGYSSFRVRPHLPPQLDFVEAETPTVMGLAAVKWKRLSGDEVELAVTVPVNTEARVHVPTATRESVRESGRPADRAPGVVFERMADGRAVYRVGSGVYTFTARLPADSP